MLKSTKKALKIGELFW